MSCHDITDGPDIAELSRALFISPSEKIIFRIKLKDGSPQVLVSFISNVGRDEEQGTRLIIEGRTKDRNSRPFFASYSPETRRGELNFYMDPSSDLPSEIQSTEDT